MSDRYPHLFLGASAETWDNLRALARYLVSNDRRIAEAGGLAFDGGVMDPPVPAPVAASRSRAVLPPLAHGPSAGIPPAPGEDWDDYCGRAFGIRLFPADPLCHWVQSPMWRRTDPAAKAAGLRIAYMLDHGVPQNHVEIAMGRARTDDDHRGFVSGIIAPLAEILRQSIHHPIREWPTLADSIAHARRRDTVTLGPGNVRAELIGRGLARTDEIAGIGPEGMRYIGVCIGAVPETLSDLLVLAGESAGRLTATGRLVAGAERLVGLTLMGQDIARRWRDDPARDPVPERAIFIGMDGITGMFFVLPSFLPEQQRVDSPVFRLGVADGAVVRVADGVWDWVQTLLEKLPPVAAA